MDQLVIAMIVVGSILMLHNIVNYYRFTREARRAAGLSGRQCILAVPMILLILFLAGYLLVAFLGEPDLIVSSILFGGSIFVFLTVRMLRFVIQNVEQKEEHLQRLNQELQENLEQVRQNQRLREELERSNAASRAKTTFLSNMSHDIRTPLNAILGFAGLARKSGDPALIRDYLNKIESSGEHLLALINDILEMSRIESGKMELEEKPADLQEVMNHVQGMFALQMNEKNMHFSVDCRVHNRYVLCDVNRLNRVLLNLISNAYKFTPEGGTVRVELCQTDQRQADQRQADLCQADQRQADQRQTDLQQTDQRQAEQRQADLCQTELQQTGLDCLQVSGAALDIADRLSREDGADDSSACCYILQVEDNGIGMTPEFAGRVFDAFERERTSTVSRIQGTGLGMAITKKIVDLMGGTIEVRTAPQEGTTFTVRFCLKPADPPRFADSVQPRKETGHEQEHVNFSGKRLLLAEDIVINREIAVAVLTQMGFQVDAVADGQEAVDRIAASAPGTYQAVLMDIQMPVMDGYEATRKIRTLSHPYPAEIPIIAMTANAFQEDVQAAYEAGMDGHVPKPIDLTVLRETLERVL